MAGGQSVSDELIQKTYDELGYDPVTNTFTRPTRSGSSPISSYPSPNSSYHRIQPKAPFRIRGLEKTAYQSATGTTYRYSAIYRNAIIFQFLIEKWLAGLDARTHHRLITQDTDACRSMVANIGEGYARPTTVEYIQFLGYSLASLEEVATDVDHARDTALLPSRPGSGLAGIGIILKPTMPPTLSYSSPKTTHDPLGDIKRQLGEIRREDLTYEIFVELINKTRYLYKRTVEGLWGKLSRDEQDKLNAELRNIRSQR
ncbi:MAG: four helix bundle protein [Candidatus Gottesmanbacteria bacterium]|nr:four helix bundle protein [Candidatus Gottesmanbacteria bacterium]